MIRANGVELAYEEEGTGEPLVLVHGSWADRSGWRAVFPKLASQGFRTIAYDRRGHGGSESIPGSLNDDASDLRALIESLEASPAHVVCSSRGGAIALRLAARRPDLFATLNCHEPPLASLLPPHQLEEVLAGERKVCELIEAGDHVRAAETFVEEVAFGPGSWRRLPERVRQSLVHHAGTFLEECRDPLVHEVDIEKLRSFPRPVLLTRGARGPSWYGTVIEALEGVLPLAQTHVFAHAGHVPQAEAVGDFVRVATGFARAGQADSSNHENQ